PAWESALYLQPVTANVNNQDHLTVGGCDVLDLAREFGSPLYVYDEATIRTRCRQYVEGLSREVADSLVIYASKAFANGALFRLIAEEGFGLDVVSGGELALAQHVDFPLDRVYFHGNNKLPDELELGVKLNIGRFVIDNIYELDLLDALRHRHV